MRKLLSFVLLVTAFHALTWHANAQVHVVCSYPVVLGITIDGQRVYGKRCSNPVPYNMQQNIPNNCKWFHTLDQAHEWMITNCDE
jgi:hypothetical protein